MPQYDSITAEEEHRFRANNIIYDHVFWGAWAGIVPVPLIDLLFMTSLQLKMMREICVEYGVKFDLRQARAFLFALTGGGASALATIGLSAGKATPAGVGVGVSLAVLAGASTYAVGRVFLSQLEKAREMSALDANSAKEEYQELLKEGQEIVRDAAKRITQ